MTLTTTRSATEYSTTEWDHLCAAPTTPADLTFTWVLPTGERTHFLPQCRVADHFDRPIPASWPSLAAAYGWIRRHYLGPDEHGIGLDWT